MNSLNRRKSISMKLFATAGCLAALAITSVAGPLFQPVHSFGLTDSFDIGLTAPLIQGSDGSLYGTIETGPDTGYGEVFRITTNGAISIVYSLNGGSDGAEPQAGVYQANDGKLYGTAYYGGIGEFGTAFSITTNGAFTLLYSFTNGVDGANPAAYPMQAADGNFYGTASAGGGGGYGTVFRISASGQFTPLHSFTGGDGAAPLAGLMQASDGNLYGTTLHGGADNYGTVYRITTNGAFTSLHSFNGSDGTHPECVLVQGPYTNLHGTTSGMGDGTSTVFAITTEGVLTTLEAFNGNFIVGSLALGNDSYFYGVTGSGGADFLGSAFRLTWKGADFSAFASFGGTNGGGAFHSAGLVQASDGNFYGTAFGGLGSIYQLDTNGDLTMLYSFSGNDGGGPSSQMAQARDGNLYGTASGVAFRLNTNGTYVEIGGCDNGPLLATSDGNLYGESYNGGSNYGAIFRLTTNGNATTIYTFTNGTDGANPSGALIQGADGNFYGAAVNGGAASNGVIFRITTNGALTPLYRFSGGNDGAHPQAALLQRNDGKLCGSAGYGGASGNGAIYLLTTNGAFSLLHTFGGGPNDGARPNAPLVQAKNGVLYGTTANGGASGDGTVFQITTDGTFSLLDSFSGQNDGGNPSGVILATDGNLYGTTSSNFFQLTTNGALTTIHVFNDPITGENPNGGLIQASDGNLYGTTGFGGLVYTGGTIYRVVLGGLGAAPAVQFANLASGNFSFGFAAATGQSYTVQQNTNLATTNWTFFTNLVGAGSPVQLSVPATNTDQFFRLREP